MLLLHKGRSMTLSKCVHATMSSIAVFQGLTGKETLLEIWLAEHQLRTTQKLT